MKRSNRTMGALAAIALAATTFLSQAQAATASLVFAPLTITNPGDPVGVDIVINGLSAAAGGFSLKLDYDANLLFGSYSVGPGGTLGPSPLDLSLGDLGGTVDLLGLADSTLTEAQLFAAQNSGGPFTIAHVGFTGVAPGGFTLGLRDVAVANFLGDTNDPDSNLLVCTGAACSAPAAVPEPMSALLVATALGGLALRRRQQHRA